MSNPLLRRKFLKSGFAGVALTLGGCTGSGEEERETLVPPSKYGSWFDDTSNYDDVTLDKRDQDEVTVMVGAEGNGGNLAFDPPAIMISPGTTVIWEWTGEGGEHDVIEQRRSFESERASEEGSTFEQEITEHTSISQYVHYYCSVHDGDGMRGAIAVD